MVVLVHGFIRWALISICLTVRSGQFLSCEGEADNFGRAIVLVHFGYTVFWLLYILCVFLIRCVINGILTAKRLNISAFQKRKLGDFAFWQLPSF